MREYEVEYMGVDGKDMYDTTVLAEDIKSAYKEAMKKKDLKTDRIVSICEIM